jgi:hypothetical protein
MLKKRPTLGGTRATVACYALLPRGSDRLKPTQPRR